MCTTSLILQINVMTGWLYLRFVIGKFGANWENDIRSYLKANFHPDYNAEKSVTLCRTEWCSANDKTTA